MYKELGVFIRHIACRKAIWKDGELWTAAIGAVVAGFWFYYQPQVIVRIRSHFGDLMSVTSIIFGFVLTALIFYIQASGSWSADERVQRVAHSLVNWHVWTILCLLSLIGYVLFLWAVGPYLTQGPVSGAIQYAALAFLILYIGFQILNH